MRGLLQIWKEEQMNKIKTLIQQLCPEGVEYKELGRVCNFQRGTTITQKDAIIGVVPVIAGGKKPSYYHNTSNRTGETIAISGSGAYAGFVSYWTIPVFLSDSFSVDTNEEILSQKYVYYFLKHNQEKVHATKKGSGVPHVHSSSIAKFQIPIPPLPIQQEIVSILDKFTSLEAELEARTRQYDYYRNQFFNFEGKEVERKTLGEIGKFIRGKRFVKNDIVSEGVPCIHYGEMYTYYKIWAKEAKSYLEPTLAAKLRVAQQGDVIIVTAGETIEDIGNAVAWLGESDVVIHDACFAFSHNMNPKYVSYFFRTDLFRSQIKKYISSGKISSIHASGLSKAKIPIPSLSEQERIVSILDKFDALVNNISIGLPAEISARRKQYEYYRGMLLNFKNVNN